MGARVHAVDADAAAVAALAAAGRGVATLSSEARDLFRRPLLAAELERFEAVVLDPPRAGAQAQVRELARARVPLVVYVSCNPASFARDARTLSEGGYSLAAVTPVDQFLWSEHLELAAVFAR
ncbi:MAG: class I SAM-dependent RNA methyltransferase, partial [Defluviicoccus sp.]